MKKLRLVVFAFVALAQISVPAAMIWQRQRTLREGRVWKLRTAPVDPVDALRGRYLTLRFAAEDFARSEPMPIAPKAYVTLRNEADGFAVVDQISADRIGGDNVVQVERFGFFDNKAHVYFNFDEFWVTEANALAAEKAYANYSTRENQDTYVTVRIRDGDAAIEELYIAGQPLREFLRTQPAP